MTDLLVDGERCDPAGARERLHSGLVAAILGIAILGHLLTASSPASALPHWLLIAGFLGLFPFTLLAIERPLAAWVLVLALTLVNGSLTPALGVFGLADIGILGLGATRLVRRARTTGGASRSWVARSPRRMFLLIAAYVMAATIGAFMLGDTSLAVKEAAKWIEIGLWIWVTTDILRTDRELAAGLTNYWLVFAAASAVLMATRILTWVQLHDTPYLRTGGGEGALTVITSVVLMWFSPQPSVRRLARFAIVPGVFAVLVSLSRQSVITVFLAMSTLAVLDTFYRKKPFKGLMTAAIVSLVATTAFFALPGGVRSSLVQRLQSLNPRVQTASNLARESLLHAGTDMWRTHKVWGVGAGRFPEAVKQYPIRGVEAAKLPTIGPHNWFVNTAAETGTVGFLAFATLILAITLLIRPPPPSVLREGSIAMMMSWALIAIWMHWLVTMYVGDITGPLRVQFATTVGLICSFRASIAGRVVPYSPVSQGRRLAPIG